MHSHKEVSQRDQQIRGGWHHHLLSTDRRDTERGQEAHRDRLKRERNQRGVEERTRHRDRVPQSSGIANHNSRGVETQEEEYKRVAMIATKQDKHLSELITNAVSQCDSIKVERGSGVDSYVEVLRVTT